MYTVGGLYTSFGNIVPFVPLQDIYWKGIFKNMKI